MAVSERSIKTYVSQINQISPGAIFSSPKGYVLNREKIEGTLEDPSESLPQTSKDRVNHIISTIIKTGPQDSFELCDTLFISYSTLKAELRKVKRILAKHNLQLVIHQDLLSIAGIEKDKRQALSDILYEEAKGNFLHDSAITRMFDDLDVSFIRNLVLKILEEHHYFINDYSLTNVVMHICISIDRIRNGYISSSSTVLPKVVRLHEHQLCQRVVKAIEEHFGIEFVDAEVQELTLLLVSRSTNLDYQSINRQNLVDYIGHQCLNMVEQMIQDIAAFYYLDLNDPEFFIRFALHVHNLLIRYQSDTFSRNPLTESIKKSCPLLYNESVVLAGIIKEKTGMLINDDEIAYLAFHLGSTIEIQKDLTNKIKVTLFTPDFYDLSERLKNALQENFSDSLMVHDILSKQEQIAFSDGDLLITTIPLKQSYKMPYIVITPFLSTADRQLINNTVTNIQKQKRKTVFEKNLRHLLVPDLFKRINKVKDKEELIHQMVSRMVALNYVEPSFEAEILDRESISSTAFGSFAVPHAMRMNAKKTGMHLVLLDEAVPWQNYLVKMVLMLSFDRNERYIFNEVYEPLTMILAESECFNRLSKAKDYEEFITMMVGYLE